RRAAVDHSTGRLRGAAARWFGGFLRPPVAVVWLSLAQVRLLRAHHLAVPAPMSWRACSWSRLVVSARDATAGIFRESRRGLASQTGYRIQFVKLSLWRLTDAAETERTASLWI